MTKAVLIMTDGLRPDAYSPERTPNLLAFRARSAWTMAARSVTPSITLPCHMSIFHSVPPARHGVLDNNWHPMARPVMGLVEHLKAHEKRSGILFNWDVLRDIYRVGHLHYNFFVNTGYDLDGDDVIADQAVRVFQEDCCDFVFVYFATVDVAGHEYGWMSDGYLKHVQLLDGLVGKVVDAIPESATVLIHSDHGGHERTHGTELEEDMTIPWMIAGPNVRAGKELDGAISLLDTAPTMAHVLGVLPHTDWEGRVVQEAFR